MYNIHIECLHFCTWKIVVIIYCNKEQLFAVEFSHIVLTNKILPHFNTVWDFGINHNKSLIPLFKIQICSLLLFTLIY